MGNLSQRAYLWKITELLMLFLIMLLPLELFLPLKFLPLILFLPPMFLPLMLLNLSTFLRLAKRILASARRIQVSQSPTKQLFTTSTITINLERLRNIYVYDSDDFVQVQWSEQSDSSGYKQIILLQNKRYLVQKFLVTENNNLIVSILLFFWLFWLQITWLYTFCLVMLAINNWVIVSNRSITTKLGLYNQCKNI